MSIEAKIEGLIKALENQTAAIQHSALVMASLIDVAAEAPKKTRKTKTEKDVGAVAAEAVAEPAAEAVAEPVEVATTVVESAPVVEAPVVATPPREVTAETLRAEAIKLIGQLKGKLNENQYAEFTTKLKGTLYPSFKTVNGAVKCLDDTNVMDDFGRGEFLTAIEKLVAEYAG